MKQWNFSQQLEQWGPNASTNGVSLTEARQYCRDLAKVHYENFPVSSWLVPAKLRPHMQAVYAYCRWADDLGDAAPEDYNRTELLQWWRTQLYACFEGEQSHPVFVALAETIEQCLLPIEPFDRLIEAFLRDQTQTSYDTYDDLLSYCHFSANPVGELVLRVFGQFEESILPYSNAICTSLQLINFWQDVARDWEMGRLYLPKQDLAQFGVTLEMLEQPTACNEVKQLLQFQVERTRKQMQQGIPLLLHLNGRLRLEIHAIIQGGLKVLHLIKEQDYDVLHQRPKLTKWHLLEIGLTSLFSLTPIYQKHLRNQYAQRKEP